MNDSLTSLDLDRPSLFEVIISFIMSIDSISDIMSLILTTISLEGKKAFQDMIAFMEKYGELIEETEDGKKYAFGSGHGSTMGELVTRPYRYNIALDLVSRSLVISLVSQFDVFFGNLVSILSTLKPETLNIGEMQITFAQLNDFASVQDAKEYLIGKEIDSLLRMSHAEMINWLEKKYNIVVKKDKDSWQNFIEVTERRNLFVHTNGVVSSQYINTCKRHGVDLPGDIHVGSELRALPNYIQSVYECIFEIGVGIAQILWRKLLPNDIEAADNALTYICYDLLKKEKFDLAKKFSGRASLTGEKVRKA